MGPDGTSAVEESSHAKATARLFFSSSILPVGEMEKQEAHGVVCVSV